jgi:hypothetical protein
MFVGITVIRVLYYEHEHDHDRNLLQSFRILTISNNSRVIGRRARFIAT